MFSTQGRLKRAAFVGWSAAAFIVYAAVVVAAFATHVVSIGVVVAALGLGWYGAVTVGLVVRRLHDIGVSGWWSATFPGLIVTLTQVNGTSFYFPVKLVLFASLVTLLVWPGERGHNRYGWSEDLEPIVP